jgi:glucose/mannose transport system permease protein
VQRLLLWTALLPVRGLLPGAAVRDAEHLAQETWTSCAAAPCSRCLPRPVSRLGQGLGHGLHRHGLRRPAALLHEQRADGAAGGAVSTAIGALNGYVLSKWRFRGSEVMFALLLFGVFMPMQVVLLPMSQVLGWLGIASSVWGLILVHVVAGIPSTTLFFRNYYVGLPDELIKAAMLDGAGFWQIFQRIVLPLSTPILVVTLIWQFTNIWNDFLYGVVFSGADSKPVTVGLNNLANTSSSVKEYNVDMAAAMIAGLPTLLVYVLAGKYFVRGLTAGAVKG